MSGFRYTKVSCTFDGKVWVDKNGRCTKCADKLLDICEAFKHLSPELRPPEVKVVYKTWRQCDGTSIRIKDMTDHHLVAAIQMTERRSSWRAKQREDLIFEAKVRGIDLGPDVMEVHGPTFKPTVSPYDLAGLRRVLPATSRRISL